MSAKKSVPELRFKGFSGEWEEQQLKEVVEFIGTGKSTFNLSTKKVGNKLYPVLGSRAVIGYDSKYDYLGNFILTARVGENAGKLYTYSGKVKISDNTVYIKTENLDYFYYFLTKFDLSKLAFGTGQPLIKSSELSNLKLFLPNKQEQTKIGNYFQNLDKLIEQKEKKYQKLGQLKKAILEKMFPKEGATTPEIRFKGFSGEWEEKGLDSISEQISYGLTVRPKYIEVGIPLISARELKNGNINYNLAPKISIKSYNELSEKAKARKGDIFLTKTGTVGLSAYVRENFPIAITQNIAVIRVVNRQYNHQFILQTFKTQNFYKKSISQVNQSTIMDLQLQDIRKLLISFPNKQEQTKIANSLQKLDNLIDLQNQELQKLKNIKKASLAKMFV